MIDDREYHVKLDAWMRDLGVQEDVMETVTWAEEEEWIVEYLNTNEGGEAHSGVEIDIETSTLSEDSQRDVEMELEDVEYRQW